MPQPLCRLHQNLSTPSLPHLVLASLLLVVVSASPSLGHTILVDLGDNFSDLSASHWNTVVYNTAVADLIDDTGAPTGVSFTPQFWPQDYQNGSNWIEDTDWVTVEAATDHFGTFFQSNVVFGNLDGLYKVEVVCAHPQTGITADVTINGSFADGNFQNIMGVDGDDFDGEADGRAAKNWLIWDSVTPIGGSMTLGVQVVTITGKAFSVNAIRLTRVGDLPMPEVSTSVTADPITLDEPGGSVDFTVRLDNTGDQVIDITSLTDDVYGDLDGQGDCSMPQNIGIGSHYQCTFGGAVTGDAGFLQTNTVTANGSATGGAVSDTGSAMVEIVDVLPTATVSKSTACENHIEEPGGDIAITVDVANTSAVESMTLTDLFDSQHGDLDGLGDCSVPQTIAAGASYRCTYTANVSGVAGSSETSSLTATFEDNDSNTETAEHDLIIAIEEVGATVQMMCFETGDLSEWAVVEPPLP